MPANKANEENTEIDNTSTDPQEPVDFFEKEMNRYISNLEVDSVDAYRRYGFTLYHSLPAAHMVVESRKLGFYRDDAIDHYNLAGLEASNENYEAAVDLLEKALKEDDTLADAAHNLALCYEKLDRKADAIAMWNTYRSLVDEDDEGLAAVDAHMAELQA